MTFPLPLVPFEQYMVADSSAEYPRTFVIEVLLEGCLDRPALEAAWQRAVSRQPLLRAVLVESAGRQQWQPATSAPPLDWADAAAPIEQRAGQSLDITQASGVRLYVRAGADKARLVIEFHHACCDGVGGLQFIGDLLACYARQVAGDEAATEPVELQPELLAGRGTFGLSPPTLRELARDIFITLAESLRLVARRSRPVIAPMGSGATNQPAAPFPGIESYTFTPEELAGLRRAAKAAGATLNDLLMRDLFLTIAQWNAGYAPESKRAWLRINVPTNLRRREDERMPAANVMSFTFIDRRVRDCRDPERLLESIRREMEAIKRWRLGLYFIGQLAALAAIPRGMPLMMTGRRCFATAVLTNVGDPTRRFSVRFPRRDNRLVIGNLLLENILGSPPLRPLTRAGAAITAYAGQLTLSLRCDPHCFTQQQTRALLDAYVAIVKRGTGREPAR